MQVSEWLVTPLDEKIDNKGHKSDELIEMIVVLDAKALFKPLKT